MNDDDWKRMIENWKYSRKRNELKSKLKIKQMHNLSKQELQDIIRGAKEYSALSEEDKEAFDWLDEMKNITPQTIITSLSKTLLQYLYYKEKYLRLEDYMMCAELRDVAKLEVEEAKRMMNMYFNLEDSEYVFENIIPLAQSEVDAHYDEWLQLMNEQEEE